VHGLVVAHSRQVYHKFLHHLTSLNVL
jgi:hypothetical protein